MTFLHYRRGFPLYTLIVTVLSPTLSLPVAKYEYPWNGRLARARVLDFCKKQIQAGPTDKEIDAACAKRAFLLQRDGEPNYTREAWDLPYADVLNNVLTIIPMGVKALASGHGVQALQDVSDAEQERMRRHVCALYDKVRTKHTQMPACPFEKGSKVTRPISGAAAPEGCPPCPCAEDDEDEKTAAKKKMAPPYSRTAAGIPVLARTPLAPPIDWFAPMETTGPVPLTIEANGRVYGHGARWDDCHAGYADACVQVPRSMQDYKFFHRGAVETDDGTLVAVGHLTVGGGHAGPDGTLQAATEHYDDIGTTVAVVSAHEDKWGVFLAGALVPEATPEQKAQLLRAPLSGDWRAFDGNLELVAMHGVNVPGFGVDRPRYAMAASGTLIFPGPYAEVDQEAINTRVSLAASILDGELDRRIGSSLSVLVGKE